METVIYEDSPLADFLQATGEADHDNKWATITKPTYTSPMEADSFSFAPRSLPKPDLTKRKRPVSQIVFTESLLSQARRKCMDTFAWRIGQSEKVKALEQLRFTIIGAQLLSDRSSAKGHVRRQCTGCELLPDEVPVEYTAWGLLYTAAAALACASSLWWATKTANVQTQRTRLVIVSTIIAALTLALYGFCLRQYRRYARNYAVRTATAMVGNAQAFDSAAYAASTFIQEVELISRGYRLSNPLPPASRLDDSKGQTRRCRRLRHALRLALDELVVSHIEAYKSLHSSANPANLERYFDMYEISRSDLADTTESIDLQANEDSESLRMLKFDLHRLFLSRRIFLCSILALDADRTAPFLDWGLVTEIMEDISTRNGSAATSLDNILDEEQHFDVPLSPRSPPSPNRERMQHHIRRFANLSQGLRGVQAKMHILREESDRFLGSADEVTSFGGYLLEQYDAIGSDMKSLLTGWEEGRTALTAIVGKNEGRISSNFTTTPSSPSRCSSPNNSLGGTTAVGGSPSDELKAQTSESTPIAEIGISEEEIFEALAFPSTRSSQTQLTREERIVKMREDRLGLAIVKDRADASRFMVKELETVIKARPRRRKPSLPITPVPFRTATGPHLPVSPKMWNREGEQQLRAVAGAE